MKLRIIPILAMLALATACAPRIVRDAEGNVVDVIVDYGIRDQRAPAATTEQPASYRPGRVFSNQADRLPISPEQERKWIDAQKQRLRGNWSVVVGTPPGMAHPTPAQLQAYRAQAEREIAAEDAAAARAKPRPATPKKQATRKPAPAVQAAPVTPKPEPAAPIPAPQPEAKPEPKPAPPPPPKKDLGW